MAQGAEGRRRASRARTSAAAPLKAHHQTQAPPRRRRWPVGAALSFHGGARAVELPRVGAAVGAAEFGYVTGHVAGHATPVQTTPASPRISAPWLGPNRSRATRPVVLLAPTRCEHLSHRTVVTEEGHGLAAHRANSACEQPDGPSSAPHRGRTCAPATCTGVAVKYGAQLYIRPTRSLIAHVY